MNELAFTVAQWGFATLIWVLVLAVICVVIGEVVNAIKSWFGKGE